MIFCIPGLAYRLTNEHETSTGTVRRDTMGITSININSHSHCCRLKLLCNKRYPSLKLKNSISTTLSPTKPDLYLLASKSGTPVRLWLYVLPPTFRYRTQYAMTATHCSHRSLQGVSEVGEFYKNMIYASPFFRDMKARIEPRNSPCL